MQITIDLDNRVAACAECGAIVGQGVSCHCGSRRHHIVMSRLQYEILQLEEDLNTPVRVVGHRDYVDAELAKRAGVVR